MAWGTVAESARPFNTAVEIEGEPTNTASGLETRIRTREGRGRMTLGR
jgi:hypothetical protein